MKSTFLLLIGIVAALSADAKPRVAILNPQQALLATDDGKAADAAMQRKFGAEGARISEQQREIDALQAQLHDETARTPPPDTAALEARIAALTARHRRAAEDLQHDFERERTRVLKDLAAKLLAIVDRYAKQKHFEVVLDVGDPQTSVYWRAEATDITAEVAKLYNQAAKKR
jgi:Skp family chaperone for outer membrane proteins